MFLISSAQNLGNLDRNYTQLCVLANDMHDFRIKTILIFRVYISE
jgi:hypothetical protein